MKAASITFIFIFSIFKLLAQPDLYPDMKLHDIDTVISPHGTADSIFYARDITGKYNNNPFLKIRKTNDAIPSIIECIKYVFNSPVDSIPVERAEGVFDENGNFISSSSYAWDHDSGGWKLKEKRENYYDAIGRDTSCLVYTRSIQENRMVLVYKRSLDYNELGDIIYDGCYSYYTQLNSWIETTWEYDYNPEGSLLSSYQYFINSDMEERVKITSLEQKYDDRNNKIFREMYSLDKDNRWIGMEKTEWDYDAAGRKIEELVFSWNETEDSWSFARKSEYSFNTSDRVSFETVSLFSDSIDSWILNSQIHFDYDLQGNRISKTCSDYDPGTVKWTRDYRFDYTFDQEGRETGNIQYNWDDSLEEWIPLWNKRMGYGPAVYIASFHWSADLTDWIGDWKRETLYNGLGDYYLDAYYEWYNTAADWSRKSGIKWDRVYDEYDQEVEAVGYNWDPGVLDWEPGGKFEWIFNKDQDLTRSIDYAWDQEQQAWVLYSKTFYKYRKGFVTSLLEMEHDEIRVYPNPIKSFLVVEGITDLLSIDIFSTTGVLMLHKEEKKARIDTSFLPKGIYIVVIRQAGNHLITKKVIKQ